jgi:transposase InsO family protein
VFSSLAHACKTLADWNDDYNMIRSHSAIGNMPPADHATHQRSRDATGRVA